MPNIKISDLAPATLPLDPANSFFEIETLEGGVPVSRRVAAGDIVVSASPIVEGTSVDDPTAPGTFNANLQWQNALAAPLANLGFNTDTTFAIINRVHGGLVEIAGEAAFGGLLRSCADFDPDGNARLKRIGAIRVRTDIHGGAIIGAGGDPATGAIQEAGVFLLSGAEIEAGVLGFWDGVAQTADLHVRNRVHGGRVVIDGEDAAGILQPGIVVDADGATSINHPSGNAPELRIQTTTTGANVLSADTDDPGAGAAPIIILDFKQAAGITAFELASGNGLAIEALNFIHGGGWAFRGENNAGATTNLWDADPDGDFNAYRAGVLKIRTDATGAAIRGALGNDPTAGGNQDQRLQLLNTSNALAGEVGFSPAGPDIGLINRVHGGDIFLAIETGAGVFAHVYDYLNAGSGIHQWFDPVNTVFQMKLEAGLSQIVSIGNSVNQPSAGGAQQGGFSIRNNNAAPQEAGFVGFTPSGATTELTLRNNVHGGWVTVRTETAAGVLREQVRIRPDLGGPIFLGIGTNAPTTHFANQDAVVILQNATPATVAHFGFSLGDDDCYVLSRQEGGHIILDARRTDATHILGVDIDPEADTRLTHGASNEAVFRTLTAANGGANLDNQLTGAGLERILTISDIAGGSFLVDQPASDVTLADATFVTAMTVALEANSTYIVEYYIEVATPNGGGDDTNLRFNGASAGWAGFSVFSATNSAGHETLELEVGGAPGSTQTVNTDVASTTFLAGTGIIVTDGTSGDLDLDAAKTADAAADGTLFDSSWIRVHKIA